MPEPAIPRARGMRNVGLLALCQALAMTGNNILAITASLVGYSLLVDKSWATLPTAVQMSGTMLTVVPASLFMARFGRRAGFTLGAVIGGCGATIAMAAIFAGSFPLFCLGTGMLGSYSGFAAYYRFAAADTASPGFRGKAISLVMAGGVISAIFGPEAAKWSRDLFDPVSFAGCYLVILGFCCASIALLRLVAIPQGPRTPFRAGRPLLAIMRQPAFFLAVPAGMIAYGTMSLVMTATPVAMLGCGLSFASTAFVIQWHALGMYAPSFFTGHLIDRIGAPRIMSAGVVLLLACAAIALSGTGIVEFWAALTLLGIGWNFLYVGATALLTEAYAPAEKAKTQAANDFLIFATVVPSSFSSGLLLAHLGWGAINMMIAPVSAVILLLLVLRRRQMRAQAAAPL